MATVSTGVPAPVALVVLGMHRSGTSALTRVLSLSGYILPATLMQPAPDNEEGFWESRPISELNDLLLSQTGSYWDDPFAFSPSATTSGVLARHHDRAVELIQREYPEGGPLVLKDPRITLLYDFWRQVLHSAGYEAAPIVCVRHPLEVAASLGKRNKFPTNKSLLVWLSYQLAAERVTRDGRRAFVMYDDLISDWRSCLDRVERSHAFALERRDPEAEVLIERFIKPDLRHHAADDQRDDPRHHLPTWIVQAYDWFKDAAREGAQDPAALNTIVAEYLRQRKWFGPLVADAKLQLAQKTAEADRKVSEIEARLVDADATYRAELNHRDLQIEAQSKAHTREADHLKEQVAETNRVRLEQLAKAEHDLEAARNAISLVSKQASETVRDSQAEAERRLRDAEEGAATKLAEAHAQLLALGNTYNGLASELQRQSAVIEGLSVERDTALSSLADAEAHQKVIQETSGRRISELETQIVEAGRIYEARIVELERQVLQVNDVLRQQTSNQEGEIRRQKTMLAHLENERARAKRGIDELTQAHESALAVSNAEVYRLTTELAEARELLENSGLQIRELGVMSIEAQNAAGRALEAARDRIAEVDRERQAEIERISRAFEVERERRESEIRAEIWGAQDVIQLLQSDLARTQVVARERGDTLSRLIKEQHELTSSTLWRAMGPIRWFGRKLPLLSRTSRKLRSFAGGAVQGGRRAKSQGGQASANGSAAQDSGGGEAQKKGAARSINAEPIAAYLTLEHGHDEYAADWREHCRRFPLPIDIESSDKPRVSMQDGEAAGWIRRCVEAGAQLLPVNGAPDVSIIIPVYNQLAFTLSAIASVYAQRTGYTYEILIGDDASSDQTRLLADAGLPRVRVVRHEKNVGFLLNCNIAAAQANGAYIVLLNNDAVVLPGWLDELIGTLKADPKAGFVGSKLLYANGTLQEAGGVIWQDGSAWNWGRNQDPRDPRYCYAREVDYVSGASIALPMDLWRQLGGFDGETYENSYYEDVDLAFRVRAAGRKVIYQPLSAIVHFEGISSGVDVTAGTKKYQIANGQRFMNRWRDVLKTHRPNAVEPVKESERGIKGRLLVIDAVTPTPDHDAGSLVMMETIRSFQACGWRVSFVPEDNFAHLHDVTSRLQRSGVEALYWPHFQSVDEILQKRGGEFDIVLISRVGPASKHLGAVRNRAPAAKVIFNTVDLHFLREQREAQLSQDPEAVRRAEKTRAAELQAVGGSELTIVHSTVEEDILKREAPNAQVCVLPWVSPVRRPTVSLPGRRKVLFIGGFRHAPNVDGLRWFLQEIWPRVRAQAPDATFNVIGSEAPAEFDAYNGRDGVTMMGWVQNLDPQLDIARVSVAPLRYGAGVKGKVISAISCGVPVVCTSIACEGTGMKPGQDVIVANDPEEFAASVLLLLKDDGAWGRLSESGLSFVEQNYSRNAADERVAGMIAAVGLKS